MLAARPAGIAAEAFSATATFVNPTDQPAAPWDYGLAFHLDQQASTVQEVYLDAVGFWYYTDFPNGVQQSGTVPTFDPSPGGTNTIDLIVDGATALLGVNGAFVARIELPSAMAADVLAATDFVGGNVVEGREIIYSAFQVWQAPDLASLPTTPAAAGPDDAAEFAAALAARKTASRFAGPFADELVQRQDAPALSAALSGSREAPRTFSATVTFVNPTEQTETPWDVGFAFGRTPDSPPHAVYVDSEGFWYFRTTEDFETRAGYVPAFDPAAGAANTLDLIVVGDTALFGVNGTFVASIDVPPPPRSGLWVGTGFYVGHAVVGRKTSFRDFEVWR
jgi:hypothetical protein